MSVALDPTNYTWMLGGCMLMLNFFMMINSLMEEVVVCFVLFPARRTFEEIIDIANF